MEQPSVAAASGLGAELSDAALVGLFRDGAGDFAIAELIRRHQITIFRLLLTLLGDPDDAERACEQVFFEAARRLGELDKAGSFHSFVAGLARAHCQKLEEQRKTSHVEKKKPRPPPKNPRAAVKRQVQDILRELGNDERVALVLADLEGESYESIASTLGTSAAEAENMVAVAREKFVDALTQGAEPTAEDEPGAEAGDDSALAKGSVLGGRYRIEELLGSGGMGAVYRAKDLENGQQIALKVLLPMAAKDPSLRRRFAREAELIRRLEHPNFVRFVEYGGEEGEPAYVVMEYIDGHLLSRVLELETRLQATRALHIVRHLLVGLGWAHEKGVVHRDIKPANVMLVERADDHDFAKILDLGIARALSPADLEKTRLTQKNEIFGTPVYMSPEQVRGEDVDGRSDLYSLTVLLFELLTARPPFQAKNSMALFAMHLASEAPGALDVAPDLRIPQALQELLDRGLEKDPALRFASASEYLSALDQVLGSDWTRTPTAAPRQHSTGATRVRAPKSETSRAPGAPRAGASVRVRERLRRIPFSLAVALIVLVAVCIWKGFSYFRNGR